MTHYYYYYYSSSSPAFFSTSCHQLEKICHALLQVFPVTASHPIAGPVSRCHFLCRAGWWQSCHIIPTPALCNHRGIRKPCQGCSYRVTENSCLPSNIENIHIRLIDALALIILTDYNDPHIQYILINNHVLCNFFISDQRHQLIGNNITQHILVMTNLLSKEMVRELASNIQASFVQLWTPTPK